MDSKTCTFCESGWSLFNDTCLKSCPKKFFFIDLERRCSYCPKGQYEILDNKAFQRCEPCNPKCSSCLGNKDYCLSCSKDFFSHNGNCLTECPPGTTKDLSFWTCSSCHETCQNCFGTSNTSCINCVPGLNFFEGSCYKNCPLGTFKIQDNSTCSLCHYSCKECFGPNELDCKIDCHQSRYFIEKKSYGVSKSGSCLCNEGFFERNTFECGGKNICFNYIYFFF